MNRIENRNGYAISMLSTNELLDYFCFEPVNNAGGTYNNRPDISLYIICINMWKRKYRAGISKKKSNKRKNKKTRKQEKKKRNSVKGTRETHTYTHTKYIHKI